MNEVMFGCVRYDFGLYEIPKWSEVEEHMGERGFCKHPCAESGKLVWLHYYQEGSLTYCPKCGHYGILVRKGS